MNWRNHDEEFLDAVAKVFVSFVSVAAMYEIVYDYDDGWSEHRDNVEIFEGSWLDLQDHIKRMRRNGCYNICATSVKE